MNITLILVAAALVVGVIIGARFGRILLLLALVIVGLGLAACQSEPSPVEVAKADQIRAATQATADAASQAAQSREIDLQRKQAEAEVYKQSLEAAARDVQNVARVVVNVIGIMLLASVVVILYIGTQRFVQVTGTVAQATEVAAMLKAAEIHLDISTGTYPLLVRGNAIHNPNTGEVLLLGRPQDADSMQVQADALVRVAGLGARAAQAIGAASRASNPQAVDAAHALPNIPQLLLVPNNEDTAKRSKRIEAN